MHQGWDVYIWQDEEFDAERLFPLTYRLWKDCTHPVQMSGLLRLEAVYNYGGFYVDSDVECIRSFEPLRHLPGSFIVGTEDGRHKTDAVFGAAKHSPVLKGIIDRVLSMDMKAGPLYTGPHNMTLALDNYLAYDVAWAEGYGASRWNGDGVDYTLLPEKAFYPYDYKEKHDPRLVNKDWNQEPGVYAIHRWNFSWKGF